jgi:hypothetical protein
MIMQANRRSAADFAAYARIFVTQDTQKTMPFR